MWRQKAIEIGCNGERCYGFNVALPAGGYKATCSRCNTVYARQRRTHKWRTHYCTKCYREGTKIVIEYKKEGQPEQEWAVA